jgi:asparagine synthase (glutamine-hydrolysing)
VYYQEEPFGSTSIYAQWSVFRLASQSGVKVTLDGQGADELLAGYHHYFGDFFASLFMQLRWLRLLKEVHSYLSKHASGKGTIHGIGFMLPSNLQISLRREGEKLSRCSSTQAAKATRSIGYCIRVFSIRAYLLCYGLTIETLWRTL